MRIVCMKKNPKNYPHSKEIELNEKDCDSNFL